MQDYVKEVSGAQRMGMHESFYQMEALREAFRKESFEVFRNESRGLVQITRAPLDSESHEKYVNVLRGAGWGGVGVGWWWWWRERRVSFHWCRS